MPFVYKSDGTRQCFDTPAVSEDAARKELASIVGEKNITEFFTVRMIMAQACGLPRGIFHVASLTEEGYKLLTTGISPSLGWTLWLLKIDPHALEIHADQKPLVADPSHPVPTAGPGPIGPFSFELQSQMTDHNALSALVAQVASAANAPGSMKDLLGYKLRVIRPGEAVTFDFYLRRINIFVDDNNDILDITFH